MSLSDEEYRIEEQQADENLYKSLHALAIATINTFVHTDRMHERIYRQAHLWGANQEDVSFLRELSLKAQADSRLMKEWAVGASEMRYLPQSSERKMMIEISERAEETIHQLSDLFSDIIIETKDFYGDEQLEKCVRLARTHIEAVQSRIQMEFPA